MWLYEDSNYRGKVWKITADTAHLRSIGCNDKVSSVRCGLGVTAEVFQDAEYRGNSKVVSGDVPSLPGFNDKASSVLISPPAGEVWLYKDSFYRGQVWRVSTDTPNFKQLGCNDCISSIKCGAGTFAECFVDSEYRGKSLTVRGNKAQLQEFNDELSSIRVRRG